MFEIRELAPSEAQSLHGFTFPAYRHLLDLEPYEDAIRDEAQSSGAITRQPFAFGAFVEDQAAGLVLGSLPRSGESDASSELLSIYVAPMHRQRGIGEGLIAAAEKHLCTQDQSNVHGVYMTGKPSIPVLERILARRDWTRPRFRFATVRFNYEGIRRAPWIKRMPTIPGYETVPWTEIDESERRAAMESDEVTPWIIASLRFWRFAPELADPITSLGIRYKGEFVGWVLNHRYQESAVLRFTSTFIRLDLARLGMALPAVAISIDSMPRGGFTHGTFCTPEHLEAMRTTIVKYVTPWAEFVGETRGVSKDLR